MASSRPLPHQARRRRLSGGLNGMRGEEARLDQQMIARQGLFPSGPVVENIRRWWWLLWRGVGLFLFGRGVFLELKPTSNALPYLTQYALFRRRGAGAWRDTWRDARCDAGRDVCGLPRQVQLKMALSVLRPARASQVILMFLQLCLQRPLQRL